MLDKLFLLRALIAFSSAFELVVAVLYTFDTRKQIFRIRKTNADSFLTVKYAKSFGIALLGLSLLSAQELCYVSSAAAMLSLSAIWLAYHGLVIWNNIIHYNKMDILVHGVFALAFVFIDALFLF